jgi:hypothetical protein
MNFSSQHPFLTVASTSSTSNTTSQYQTQRLPIPTIPTTTNMGFEPNSQQQQLIHLQLLASPLLYQQAAQILFQQQLANLSTAAATPPAQKAPITKPSARAISSPNSIISVIKKLRDSLYQARGTSLIDSQTVITKKLDKLFESYEQRPHGKVPSDTLASYQRRVVRLSSQLCGRVVCDLLIRVRPVHDIHIWHLLRNKGVEFTGTGLLLSFT